MGSIFGAPLHLLALLGVAVCLSSGPSYAGNDCAVPLSKRISIWLTPSSPSDTAYLLNRAEELLREHRLQDSVLYYRAAGDRSRARVLEQKLEGILESGEFEGALKPLEYGASSGSAATLKGGVRVAMKEDGGHLVSRARSEVAAYRFDRLFDGTFRVPVTATRQIHGRTYSLQAFVEDATTSLPNRTHANLKFFDFLIDNWDRYNGTNLLQTKDNVLIPIDHGLAFRTAEFSKIAGSGKLASLSKILSDRCSTWLLAGLIQRCVRRQILESLPERRIYEKLKELSESDFRSALKTHVDENEIELVLERRKLLIETVEEFLRTKSYPEPLTRY